MVFVTMDRFGGVGIDLDRNQPIGTNLDFLFGNDLGRGGIAANPPADRTKTSPAIPAGIPGVV